MSKYNPRIGIISIVLSIITEIILAWGQPPPREHSGYIFAVTFILVLIWSRRRY